MKILMLSILLIGNCYAACDFGGSNGDYAVFSDNSLLRATTYFTCTGWLKTSKNYAGGRGTIIGKQDSNEGFAFYFDTANDFTVRFEDTDGANNLVTESGLNDGIWHSWFVRKTDNEIKLWIDGIFIGSDSGVLNDCTGTSDLYIGSKGASSEPFDGAISGVVFYICPTEFDLTYHFGNHAHGNRLPMPNKHTTFWCPMWESSGSIMRGYRFNLIGTLNGNYLWVGNPPVTYKGG